MLKCEACAYDVFVQFGPVKLTRVALALAIAAVAVAIPAALEIRSSLLSSHPDLADTARRLAIIVPLTLAGMFASVRFTFHVGHETRPGRVALHLLLATLALAYAVYVPYSLSAMERRTQASELRAVLAAIAAGERAEARPPGSAR